VYQDVVTDDREFKNIGASSANSKPRRMAKIGNVSSHLLFVRKIAAFAMERIRQHRS